MLSSLILSVFFFAAEPAKDTTEAFVRQLEKNIFVFFDPPPDFNNGDTCYHYSELLKVEIGKYSKVISIELSDSAPGWLKNNLEKQKQRRRIDYKKLDSIALKNKIKNCTIVIPYIMESDSFPCGEAKKKRSFSEFFFQFTGRNLKGNIIFTRQIRMVFPVRYLSKSK